MVLTGIVAAGVIGAEFFVCIIQRGLLFGLLSMYRANHPVRTGYASCYCSVAKKQFNF